MNDELKRIYKVAMQEHANKPENATRNHTRVTSRANKGGWKTCSRGHKYRGAGGCPI